MGVSDKAEYIDYVDYINHSDIASSTTLWDEKQLSVYFMDDGFIINDVLGIANLWQSYSGIQLIRTFSLVDSDIRVSFRTNGCWSYIGQDTKLYLRAVTLSLDSLYLYLANDIKRIVLHEFGHSLGLVHEHQSPKAKIKWNTKSLFTYYDETYNLDSNWVKSNVIKKYSQNIRYCNFDPFSIMIYEIPARVTLNNVEIKAPLELSPSDKMNMYNIYNHKPSE